MSHSFLAFLSRWQVSTTKKINLIQQTIYPSRFRSYRLDKWFFLEPTLIILDQLSFIASYIYIFLLFRLAWPLLTCPNQFGSCNIIFREPILYFHVPNENLFDHYTFLSPLIPLLSLLNPSWYPWTCLDSFGPCECSYRPSKGLFRPSLDSLDQIGNFFDYKYPLGFFYLPLTQTSWLNPFRCPILFGSWHVLSLFGASSSNQNRIPPSYLRFSSTLCPF